MIRFCMMAGLIALLSTAALAQPLSAADGWQTFYFGDSGSALLDAPVFDDSAAPLQFELLLDRAARVQIVDAGLAGDRFELFANGASLGLTSVTPASSSMSCA